MAAGRRTGNGRTVRAVVGAALLATLTLVPATPAAAFPPYDAGFHTYAELRDEVAAVASAHPGVGP